MWPVGVVLDAPVFDDDLRLGEAGELLDVQQLVAEAAVEGLHERVLPRAAGLDVRGGGAGEAAVVLQRPRDHLRAIISPEILWGTSLFDELLDDRDYVLGGAGPLDADRECLAGVLIDDVAELDAAAVGCLIELEVHGP